MKTEPMIISTDLEEALDILAENLLSSAPFIVYAQSRQDYAKNAQAAKLMEDFTQIQNHVRANQAGGDLRQEDLNTLRSLQEQVNAHPILKHLFASQQNAVDFLREINLEINQLLGIDFAQMARTSSC